MSNKYFNQIISKISKPSLPNKYLVVLVLIVTAVSINYFYSIAMILLTTFTLAYLTKGSRRT